MFLQNYINHYTTLWNSYSTIKERKYQLQLLLEKKTGHKIPKRLNKNELIKELAKYDYNLANVQYMQYQHYPLTERSFALYDKPQIGVTWIKQHQPDLPDPTWIKLIDNCQCPEFPDKLLCKYEYNNNIRSLYINLQELYNGRQIAMNTLHFRHVLRHIKQHFKLEHQHLLNNYNFLSLLPEVLQKCHPKNYVNVQPSKFKKRCTVALHQYQNKTVDWMRSIEHRVEQRKYIEYETELDYIYRWKDTNLYYNTRQDIINIGYAKLQALMAFRGGLIGTEDGLGKSRICAKLIMDNPKKYSNMYGTLIICESHVIQQWVDELKSVSDPILKIVVVPNVNELKTKKSLFAEAEVVIVAHNVCSKLSNTKWHRIIFDDVHLLPMKSHIRHWYPESLYRWALCDLPKYKLHYGNNHLGFLEHLFRILSIETQNPRRNNESFLLRKIYEIKNNYHYVGPHKNILDTNLLKAFFDNLYFRDIKDDLQEYLPTVCKNIIDIKWSNREKSYYQDLCQEHPEYDLNQISVKMSLYKKSDNVLRTTIRESTPTNIDKILQEHTQIVNDLFFANLLSIEEQLNDNVPGNERHLLRIKERLMNDLSTFNNLTNFRNSELIRIKETFNRDSQICEICLDVCETPVLLLNCMHFYCTNCIYQLNKHKSAQFSQCPKCKTTFRENDKIIYYPNGVITTSDLKEEYGSKIGTLIELLETLDNSIIYTPNYEIKKYLTMIFDTRNISSTHHIFTGIYGLSGLKDTTIDNFIIFDDIDQPFKSLLYKDFLDILYHINANIDKTIMVYTFIESDLS